MLLIGTAGVAAYVLAYAFVLLIRPFGDSTMVAFDDIGGLIATFAASGLLFVASRSTGANIRRGWLRLSLALFAWGIGDAIWATYELALDQEAPFPSIGDAFYLAGYPLLFVGVLSFSHRDRVSLSVRTALDAVAVTLAGSAVIWRVAVEPIFRDSTAGTLQKILSGLYPMGDILVLFALMLAIFRHKEGRGGTVFGIFAAGMLVVLASDVAFAYLENAELYATGSLVDAGWVFGFLLMGYGGLLQISWNPQYVTESGDLSDPAWKQGLPLIVMVTATSWVILEGLDGDTAGLPLFLVIVLMMCTVVVRHFLTLRENIHLRLVLEQAFHAEQERARSDPLTGRLNRRAALEFIDSLLAETTGRIFAVGMVDIDSMKRINDGFGHQCGDEVLTAVAAALDHGALVGRYGGDEFLIVIEAATSQSPDDYRSMVDSTLADWSASRTDGLILTVSMGFAFAPAEGSSAARLIEIADQRMYLVKKHKTGDRRVSAPAA
jgi:diguanylate cyclase (GGDEF)-like protein